MDNINSQACLHGPSLSGLRALSDLELLALFFSSVNDRQAALSIAHRLLTHFGDLRAVLNSSPQAFSQATSINDLFYMQLQAACEICKRCDWQNLKARPMLTNIEQAHSFLKRQLRDNRNEIFSALFLNSQQHILAYEELFFGSINQATLHPRHLVERIFHHNAAALILAHNHPSGTTTPSKQDVAITQKLAKTLKLLDVVLLDHLIIGDNAVYSIRHAYQKPCF